MDCIESQCTFLYKQEFHLWTENQEIVSKFGRRSIDLVQLIAAKASENDDSFSPYIIENCIGSLYYTVEIQDLELFTFTDNFEKTVTTFKLSLEESNLGCLLPYQDEGTECKLNDFKSIYEPVYLCDIINGSIRGSRFLAFSDDGRIFVIDWITKIGTIVGRWPINPAALNSGCYGLMPYEPRIEGAISSDGSLVAVIGPSFDNDNQSYIEIRLFDVKTQECSSKKLNLLDPEVKESDISYMSFNPGYQNLLYLMFSPDFGNKSILIVYDHKEENILAKRNDVLLSGHFSMEYHYETSDGPVFIHNGNIVLAYVIASSVISEDEEETLCNHIVLLDAFKLDTIATIKLSPMGTVLRYHFIVSTCQTQIAIFTKEDSTTELEVQVFKIPDHDISLKNLCRRVIVGSVEEARIEELTMLPSSMRDYLKI